MDEVVMAVKVRDFPEPFVLSVKRKCERCDEEIWVEERLAKYDKHFHFMCMECFHHILDEGEWAS